MPSPFPGMDPYLESPARWADFHNRFAEVISSHLNKRLPPPYFAQLAVYEQIGVLSDRAIRKIVPDVSVKRPRQDPGAGRGAIGVLDAPRTELSESVLFEIPLDIEEIPFVEIRDATSADKVITVLEILSPANKRAGEGGDSYVKKRKEILGSDTSLIEIDLLRSGSRQWAGLHIAAQVNSLSPCPEYVALVNRAWPRTGRLRFQVFPITLQQTLPVIPVPLRQGEPEVPLDLQHAMNETYDRGPFQRMIDYSVEPLPPLPEELRPWAAELTTQRP